MKMATKDTLYISSENAWNSNESLQSQVALFVLKFCNSLSFQVVVVHPNAEEDGDLTSDLTSGVGSLSINVKITERDRNNQISQHHNSELESVDFKRILNRNLPEVVKNSPLPAILDSSGQLCMCGLSTVLRRIVLLTSQEQCRGTLLSLLGFRQTSLENCAEASVWTKLVDSCITKDVAELCQDVGQADSSSYLPPDSVVILEQKLSVPVSTFNIHHQQRQRSEQDGKLLNSEVTLEKVVSDYKTEKIIVNKKAYKDAIRAYKEALGKGELKPGTKFKESKFYISLDTWREKMANDDENGTQEGDHRRKSVHDNIIEEKERSLEQRFPETSLEASLTSGFEHRETDGNCDEDLVKNENFCNSKHLKKHLEGESNESENGKHCGHLSGKRSSENFSSLASSSCLSLDRVKLNASKLLPSNSPQCSNNTNHTNESKMLQKERGDSESDLSQQSDSESNLKHIFTEGSKLTLTDLALFLPVHIFVKIFKGRKGNFSSLQHIVDWYKRMWCLEAVKRTALEMDLEQVSFDQEFCKTHVDVAKPIAVEYQFGKGRSRKARNHAIKRELPAILSKVKQILGDRAPMDHPCGNSSVDWSAMPAPVSPQHGEVPPDRLLKKHQQIESLVSVVMTLARDGDTVVDFCSGGGHVGIVLAHLLPSCQIIMIEKNIEAIRRAHQRVKLLHLSNVILFQSNIDYFRKSFDIGVSLHACGVATDIVIDKCIEQQASFVSSPCCYGSINPTSSISYPRSNLFRSIPITTEEFMVVAHAAEHTSWEFQLERSKRGKLCMTIIDEDRSSYVKEHGYRVTLCSLTPLTCSPKNNLLIGVKGGQPLPSVVSQMV
ncbi:Glutathione S-transferase C-terminal domain-containing protein [Holothuria leucospilota]|uniref:Glutathione S-transferase C-terminal domain-containing protein n=1 Tax=Holothuria leucospilota TaxID=206669 RepID=A0A9Q1BKJ5_HOLLE|nr:Glutathione S-transferase C-terminal domain-containing protein [Holothuria leucospilota]